jgi:acyl dehydratase
MAIVYDKLKNRKFADIRHDFTAKDTILYALGLGLGQDPLDEAQLRFVYEDGLQALPTMAVVLAYPGFWIREPDTGVDWVKVLHGEQAIRIHKPLPTHGRLVGKMKIDEIVDKGAGKGALIYSSRDVYDVETNELICTLEQTTFARGDGGFGGPAASTREPHPLPERAPDLVHDLPTRPEAALIYRLSGDLNPLHADPKVAQKAGYKQPILHGLCTLGVAGHALLKSVCGYDPTRFKAMQLRFSAPVYPGETIRTEMWRDAGVVSFRSKVVERDVVVLNNGRAEIA